MKLSGTIQTKPQPTHWLEPMFKKKKPKPKPKPKGY